MLIETEQIDHTIAQRNVELVVPRLHFIDGGSEKVHIQAEKSAFTRCSHHFKHYRVMEVRALDSYEVCRRCCQQGGIRSYPTGKRIKWDDTTRTVIEANVEVRV